MSPRSKNGMTLIEMLVAMTASLILFGAVVTILQILGDAVGRSRRAGRLESDMCSVRTRLQLDLAGVTANRDANGLQVEVDSGSVSGYFEVIEGPNSDLLDYSVNPAYDRSTNDAGPGADSNDRIVGDTDDLLFFTTRNVTLDPFMGRLDGETITADSAEVAYFCRPTPNTSNPTLYTLYRRQLLIIGGYPRSPFSSAGTMAFDKNWGASWREFWKDFYTNYDLSARRELLADGKQGYVLNTLNDLQRRRNRFGHDPQFSGPSALDLCPLIPNHVDNVLALDVPRQDEDVLATNVLAFDVRLLDPEAKERQTGITVRMQPGDRDYWTTITNLADSNPVYADLGFDAFAAFHGVDKAPGAFAGYGRLGHCLRGTAKTSRTYDTWTSFYAANNKNDDNGGDVDDDAERAPYSKQLGGIQVTLRLYEPQTKSVKQATIRQSFKR